jgi:hypothetical protein
MIDIQTEQLRSLTDASRLIPSKPHPSTLWRWWKRGIRGVKLETVVIGGARYTSVEALQRFADRLSAPGGGASTARTRKGGNGNRRRLEAVERELEALGL